MNWILYMLVMFMLCSNNKVLSFNKVLKSKKIFYKFRT